MGLGVVVREFLQRMQFVETLNEMLPWDVGQCAVSPGQRILALVMALVDDRWALYRMPEVYEDRDVELLLGAGVRADQLNDNAAAAGELHHSLCRGLLLRLSSHAVTGFTPDWMSCTVIGSLIRG